MRPPLPPPGVVVSAVFFAACGVLHLVLEVAEAPRPLAFWPVWDALGRAIFYWLLAAGLWRRLALCRTIAIVYCLAALATYLAALLLALFQAPFQFPDSVVVGSLVEVPSCALLFPWLRSPGAAAAFPRALFGP